jgi:hypothetical protein
MAIETHEDGTVASIAMLQANRAGEIRDPWFVPTEGVAVATTASKPEREGVDLPPPPVSLKPVKTETDDGDDDGGSK